MSLLYAIVHSLSRAHFFLEGHVPYLQLRFKDQPLLPHLSQIQTWITQYPLTRLIINDDPEFAQHAGAWGVHLGQEDLARYRPEEFSTSPLHLGLSTHSPQEIEHALSYHPTYLGFGPIFSTQTKQVAAQPQGIAALEKIVQTQSLPIVAIGGIHAGNLAEVLSAHPHAIAMISGLDGLQTQFGLQQFQQQMRTQTAPTSARTTHN